MEDTGETAPAPEDAASDDIAEAALVETLPAEPSQPQRVRGWKQFDNPYLILGALFFVTAAPGLPMLWVSKKFTPLMKVVWSVVVVLYTALILYLFYLCCMWSWGQISDALKL